MLTQQRQLAYTQTKQAAKLPPQTSHPSEYQVRPADSRAAAEHRERPLKVFAIDPSRGTGPKNVVTLRLPYEPLQNGPIGRLIEIIDEVDVMAGDSRPAAKSPVRIEPVNLDDPKILLDGGLAPSEIDLQSHQQMAYAVAMYTIGSFERALGREMRWAWASAEGGRPEDRLRIYPHAMEMASAFYDTGAHAVYLGYFHPEGSAGTGPASEIVYTTLAFDMLTREVTFPLFEAITGRGARDAEESSLVYGFADLVALLQHFDFQALLVDAVIRTGGRIHDSRLAGDLEAQPGEQLVDAEFGESNPLLEIAGQLGQEMGLGGPVRTALMARPDPSLLAKAEEPHARGAILTAAVFDAFITIYSRRTADLRRVANVTSRQATISPDLADRMAAEAAKAARQILDLCIRGLDDLPRRHFTMGDYLAALISSDSRAWPSDDLRYRETLIATFRRRGLFPQGASSLTEDGLRWLADSWKHRRPRTTDKKKTKEPPGLPNVDLKRPEPDRRSLKTFAFDPSAGRSSGNLLSLDVPYEPLKPGPVGAQVAVVDYDASNKRYYPSIDLEQEGHIRRGGLDPSDVDPRFHQQMAYAVVMSTIDRFQTALGRRIRWPWTGRETKGELGDRLRVYPHAMQEANAYYERTQRGLLFGYFAASTADPGRNLPGQAIFTCLSADIVAHETTHALLDSVQPFFLERTGPDAPAFHEAIADVIALLGHFSYQEALLLTIQRTGGLIQRDLLNPDAAPTDGLGRVSAERSPANPLVQLAQQFGESLGNRAALRSALGRQPDPTELRRAFEAHDRGAILVAAIFDAFFSVYLRRVADLLRIGRASGAISASGDIHRDLAKRLAKEAADTAIRVSSIAARALDYCPPVDIEFGDYLRALVTADFERAPDDPLGFRAAFIDGFRQRGIYPLAARSMTEEGLLWETWHGSLPPVLGLEGDLSRPGAATRNAMLLKRFGEEHAKELGLDPSVRVDVDTIQASTSQQFERTGTTRNEFKFQIVQQRKVPLDPRQPNSPVFTFRGGSTVVLDPDGHVKYVVFKRVDSEERLKRQRDFLEDGIAGAAAAGYRSPVLDTRSSLAAQHRGL